MSRFLKTIWPRKWQPWLQRRLVAGCWCRYGWFCRRGWLFGSPDTVIRKIREHEDQGVNYFLLWTAFGTLEHSQAVKSMKLFAKEVMPAFEQTPVTV